MTAITLNLLVEEQMAQEAEARDPVKLFALGALTVIGIAVVIGLFASRVAARRTHVADALQTKWDGILANPTASTGDTKSYRAMADEIHAINRSRPLYAPQLAIIKDVVPDTIRLSQIGLMYVTEETGVPEPPNPTGDKPARRAKPQNRAHLALVLGGQAESARPEIEVDEFIKKLKGFPPLMNSLAEVRLRSIARTSGSASSAGVPALPTATFQIECQFKGQQ